MKSFVVRGDTKPFKDQLGKKGLGGKWNQKLRGGPGWIFRLSERERVAAWIEKVKSGKPVEVAPAPAAKQKAQAKPSVQGATYQVEPFEPKPSSMAPPGMSQPFVSRGKRCSPGFLRGPS